MKKLIFCFDIDNILCISPNNNYKKSKPIKTNIRLVNLLMKNGHYVKLFTSRYMGRNKENKFLKGIKSNSDFYFDHSFRMTQGNLSENFALCNYGVDFLAAFNINNIFGTQFHPEKSQSNGLRVLSNFLKS